jgi:hypothetical protein
MLRSCGIVFVLCLALSPLCFGCSCFAGMRPCEYLRSDVVFVGTVVERLLVKRPMPPEHLSPNLRGEEAWTYGYTMRFSVEEQLLGEAGAELIIETGWGGGDCGMPLSPGDRFLIFASRDEKGDLWTSICSSNARLSGGPSDAITLEPYRALIKEGTGSIFGEVTRSKPIWRKGYVENSTPQPVPGIMVRANGDKSSAVAKTGREGSYKLGTLPSGHYAIVPEIGSEFELENPTAGANGYATDINAGACVNLIFGFQPKTRIKGHVSLPPGMEEKTVEVVALPTNLVEIESFTGISAVVDNDGRFDLWPVPPGDYYVGVNIGNRPGSDAPFPPTYYPGVTARQSAAIVHIAAGDVSELELPLSEVAEPRFVNFVAIGIDGKPPDKIQIQVEDLLHPGDPGTYFSADLDRTGNGVVKVTLTICTDAVRRATVIVGAPHRCGSS